MNSHEAADEARLDLWERRALAERLRRVRIDLGAVVARLDQHQREALGSEEFEPLHLGRWLLLGIQRLVAAGRVSVEEVVEVVRQGVVEEAPGLTRNARLAETLDGLRSPESLGALLDRIEHEMVRSHLARNAFLDPYPRPREGAERRIAEQREVLLARASAGEANGAS